MDKMKHSRRRKGNKSQSGRLADNLETQPGPSTSTELDSSSGVSLKGNRNGSSLNGDIGSNCQKKLKRKRNGSYKKKQSYHQQTERNEHHNQSQKDSNINRARNETSKSHKSVESQSSTSETDADPTADQYEIPGFYYDRIKKRYFKILENSGIQTAVTKSSIARAAAEEKRIQDLKNLEAKKFKPCDDRASDFVHMLFMSRQGDISEHQFRNALMKNHVSNIKLTDSFQVFQNPAHGHECVEHMMKMISSPNCDKLLCLWTVKDTIVQRLQMVQVLEKPRTRKCQTLSVELGETNVIHSWHKITNVCWAPFKKFPNRKNILYTTNCHHTGQALVYIRDLDVAIRDDIALFDFRIGSQATWTCAWNSQTEKFSVGAEKTCLLIDVATRKLWELNTLNSDPLAQTFSLNNLLYNGTRKGQILAHDLRTSSTRAIRCLSHKSSISHLCLSYDEVYMYASDFIGQLKIWDTRKNAVVMEYNGLYNEYKRIPFHIDESNTILYGAGQDGYTRMWCVKTGKLLTCIPPPCSTSIDTIPALQFSNRWANRSGNSGLLMGLSDKIYLYS